KLHQVDDARRLDADLLQVLLGDDNVASFLELVAFDQLAVGNLALAVRAPAFLLDARLTLGVELVEGDGLSRFGRRKHLYRDVDQADLEKAFPSRSGWHMTEIIGLGLAMYRFNGGSGCSGSEGSGFV